MNKINKLILLTMTAVIGRCVNNLS